MENIVNTINDFIDAVFDVISKIAANFATNVAPLMVGVLPASITYDHILNDLGFHYLIAWTGALVIEFLGFGSASTIMEFYFHNRKYADEKNHMMLQAPILSGVWYLLVMLVFNVMLDAAPENQWIRIISIALFSTLAVPAYALVSAKVLYKTWKSEHYRAISERKAERQRAKSEHSEQGRAKDDNSTRPEEQKRVASEYKKQIQSIAERQWQATGKVSPIEIARTLVDKYGMTQDAHAATGFISTYLKSLSENGRNN